MEEAKQKALTMASYKSRPEAYTDASPLEDGNVFLGCAPKLVRTDIHGHVWIRTRIQSTHACIKAALFSLYVFMFVFFFNNLIYLFMYTFV